MGLFSFLEISFDFLAELPEVITDNAGNLIEGLGEIIEDLLD